MWKWISNVWDSGYGEDGYGVVISSGHRTSYDLCNESYILLNKKHVARYEIRDRGSFSPTGFS